MADPRSMICSSSTFAMLRCLVLGLSLAWGVLGVGQLSAQEYKYELGMSLGASHYIGDAVRRGPFGSYSIGVGAIGRYNANFRLAFTSTLGYLGLRGDTRLADNVFPEGRSAAFATHSLLWTIGAEHNFLPLSDKFRYLQTSSWSPYIGGGALVTLAWGDASSVFAPGLYLVCGLKYMLSSRMTLAAQWQVQHYLSDRLDALGRGREWLGNPFALNRGIKGGDGAGLVSISLTYHMGQRNKSSCYAPW